jgi:hypothetical protein
MHACRSSIQEVRQEDQESQVSLGYRARPCLKNREEKKGEDRKGEGGERRRREGRSMDKACWEPKLEVWSLLPASCPPPQLECSLHCLCMAYCGEKSGN